MMTFETDSEAGVIEFTVDGEVSRAEYDAAAAEMDTVIARHGKLNAVAVVRNFAGMELAAWWKDISWGVGHLTKLGRIAVVTDIGWIIAASRATSWMVPGEQKLFTPEELEQARSWARAS
ncbi:STAS/SEC14 domain-containing protein [Sphingomonas sp. HITSZ_GF]|uniref:STAS/SEC14 domain-containing protein n=1 Tax=Sphingomonas sp. HITSZ_GF TaxID=3037247 RepID=UPI00240E744C|nr:STAS/SEC14 domain-containing protein [Sphingomonas sp. HITSZ_GF]MDG2535687.1 STAS/SEC14 domain-containing protein [Sphingomonas sp. HITSZ_GF]